MQILQQTRCVLFALLLCLAGQNAQAQKYPLEVNVALTQSKIVQGEPLLLHYKIHNVSQEHIFPELGRRKDAWLTVTIRDEKGFPAAGKTRWEPPRQPGSGLYRVDDMMPGKKIEDDLALTQQINITHPGHYKVRVVIDMAYSSHSYPRHEPAERAYVGDQMLDLTVTARDDAYLQGKAEELRKTIVKGNIKALSQETAIAALFSMPEDIALPVWMQLFEGEYQMYMAYAAAELVRISTPTGIDLIFVYLSKQPEKYGGYEETRAIAQAYLTGDRKLRAHIRKTWIQKLGALPAFYDMADNGEVKTIEDAQRPR